MTPKLTMPFQNVIEINRLPCRKDTSVGSTYAGRLTDNDKIAITYAVESGHGFLFLM